MKDECFLPPYFVNDATPLMSFNQNIDWGLVKLNIQSLHEKGITGKGVVVAFLDTGVDINHKDLKIKKAINLTQSSSAEDSVGHGTHVAGIIAAQGNDYGVLGVAPDVDLYSYKVMDGNSGSLSTVARAIRLATDDGAHIITMSLGSTANIPIVEQAVDYAKSKGVVVLASSGNSGQEQKFYPSSYENVYSIGSVNSRFEISSYSSYGDHIELVAPGERILSTYIGNQYRIMSGTSMAAPFAAGCIALMKQFGVTMDYKTITGSVIDVLEPGFDKKSGFGIINPHASIHIPEGPKPPTDPCPDCPPCREREILEMIETVKQLINKY